MHDSARKASVPPADWWKKFDDPIPIQNGKPLYRLRDAANYITALPPAEQTMPHWQLAAKLLLFVAVR
jgi:hypothetical protein